MKKIVLATANTHKVIEFQRILNELLPDLELVAASQFPGVPEVEETGSSFAENALIKAILPSDFFNYLTRHLSIYNEFYLFRFINQSY